MRILVGGFLGLLPAGGVTWDYLQYPVGLAALGHDVYYVEDTRAWPVFQAGNADGADCAANVRHLAAVMEDFGLAGRWAYRDEASGRCFGLTEGRVRELAATADVLLNVSCATWLRDEYRGIPARAVIDTDPMFTQVQYLQDTRDMRALLDGHTHHFTFGENVGTEGCRVPACGFHWRPTRQPVCLDHWPATPPAAGPAAYTTLMNWSATAPLRHDGETWGQKDRSFLKYLTLPETVPGIALAVAVAQTSGPPFPSGTARRHGWRVPSPEACAGDWRAYRAFLRESRGEWSVAKETYVKARTGWFSGRSACYLASGRPVAAQDTGWSRHLPTGEGLFAFATPDEARDALRRLEAEPGRHARAARRIAEEFFDSRRVLSDLLTALGA